MPTQIFNIVASCALVVASIVAATNVHAAELRLDNQSEDLHLVGPDARLQLVVTKQLDDGRAEDVTRVATFKMEPADVITIDATGLVSPLADGEATVTITSEDGLSTATKIQVVHLKASEPISFPDRIVPMFTKFGCNGGGCHGKAAGQNGFKLSLLGFEPLEDYEYLIGESRSRRILPSMPDRSLLLMKSVNASPHGGGQRMEVDSHEYRILRRWISQGMPYGEATTRQVVGIDVYPATRRMARATTQQLALIATYADGTREDVTRAAVYESNEPSMAEASAEGLVQVHDTVGDVAVMARYQGQVTVFRADIPLRWEPAALADSSLTPEPANLVDEFVYAKLRSLGIPASAGCDDATYLRRVTLDLSGRLPTREEYLEFTSDHSADKRARYVDRLLDSPGYADFFANKWNSILRNRRSRPELHYSTVAFHDWLRRRIRENQPYDLFVRELLTASGSVASHPPVAWYQRVSDPNERVEDIAQLFLGQRIQCARCHHHPYEKWSQADYAKMSAFLSTVTRKTDLDPVEPTFVSRVTSAASPHPKTGQSLTPAGLDGEAVSVATDDDPRVALADWMTDPTNPFFAKAIVNRYWKHFMGRGLIEPEDDLRITNPPSNPELLDGLSRSFIESGYDVQHLIRMIVNSNTYATTSAPLDDNLADQRSYSRFYPKRISAEVLLDAVDDVTLARSSFARQPLGTRAMQLPDTGFDSYFLQVFGRPESTTACECERSQDANLAQSLHLLNSEEMQNKLATDTGRAATLAADDSRSDLDKVTELYQIALCRSPSDEELTAMLSHIAFKENRREAYEDVLWSLINSKEFLFNH